MRPDLFEATIAGLRRPHPGPEQPVTTAVTTRGNNILGKNKPNNINKVTTATTVTTRFPGGKGETPERAKVVALRRCAVCGSDYAPFGVGFSLRDPERVRWLCSDHRTGGAQ